MNHSISIQRILGQSAIVLLTLLSCHQVVAARPIYAPLPSSFPTTLVKEEIPVEAADLLQLTLTKQVRAIFSSFTTDPFKDNLSVYGILIQIRLENARGISASLKPQILDQLHFAIHRSRLPVSTRFQVS